MKIGMFSRLVKKLNRGRCSKIGVVVLIILLFTQVLFSCAREGKEIAGASRNGEINDTLLRVRKAIEVKAVIDMVNAAVQEKDLKGDTATKNQLRFILFQPIWIGRSEFYKVNYDDSCLVFKEFSIKGPDGSGEDSLLSSRVIKLTCRDFNMIEYLIHKSMFWGLESVTDDIHYFDKESFTYEARRNEENRMFPIKKYHFVSRYAPINGDFQFLGRWLQAKGHNWDTKKIRLRRVPFGGV